MKYKKFFSIMIIMALLGSIASLITPLLLQFWSKTSVRLDLQKLLTIIGVMVTSLLLNVFLTIYRERFAKDFNQENMTNFTRDILKMDYDALIDQGPVNIFERAVMAVNGIYAYMTGDAIKIWSSVLMATVTLVIFSTISLWLSLLLLLILPINYFGFKLLNRELAKRSQRMQKDTSEGYQLVISRLQQLDYLKQSPDHAPLLESLQPTFDRIFGSMSAVNEYAQSVSQILHGINDIGRNFALIYVVYLFANQAANSYSLILSSILLPLFFASVSTITSSNLRRTEFSVAKEFIEKLTAQTERDGSQPIESINQIELAVDRLQLKAMELPFHAHATLERGDIAKVAGPSGSGKSTFAKGLVKFRDLDHIRINKTDLREIENSSLRTHIEYLSQNIPIIKGTLRDNLFFNIPYSKDREDKLLKEPILRTIFESKTMDTEILPDGANLSGGEKQKIALARALCGSADALILDEVCSNIDQGSAHEIYDRLNVDRDARIVLIISHDDLPGHLANVTLNA